MSDSKGMKKEYINKISDFNMSKCNFDIACEKSLIDNIIQDCDTAFETPIKLRNDYNVLLDKLTSNACVLYAYRENILGYIAFYANRPEEAYISLIAIKPEYQGDGIGSYLLKVSEIIIKERGISKIKLEVRKNNKSAIGFYKHLGFNIISDASDESYYMEKKL